MNAASPKCGWALYAASLAIETAAGCLRGLLVALVLYVPTQLFGGAAITANSLMAFAIGLGPVALSVAGAALLERTQRLDTAVPYMRDRAHPYSEQRIERLVPSRGRTSQHDSGPVIRRPAWGASPSSRGRSRPVLVSV